MDNLDRALMLDDENRKHNEMVSHYNNIDWCTMEVPERDRFQDQFVSKFGNYIDSQQFNIKDDEYNDDDCNVWNCIHYNDDDDYHYQGTYNFTDSPSTYDLNIEQTINTYSSEDFTGSVCYNVGNQMKVGASLFDPFEYQSSEPIYYNFTYDLSNGSQTEYLFEDKSMWYTAIDKTFTTQTSTNTDRLTWTFITTTGQNQLGIQGAVGTQGTVGCQGNILDDSNEAYERAMKVV